MLLLPNRRPGLQLVDDIAGGSKRLYAVTRPDGHSDTRLPNLQRTDPVHHSHGLERPTVPRLGHDLSDLALDHIVVCLVLEMGDTFLIVRVVPNGAEEQGDGTALRRRNGFNEVGGVDGSSAYDD